MALLHKDKHIPTTAPPKAHGLNGARGLLWVLFGNLWFVWIAIPWALGDHQAPQRWFLALLPFAPCAAGNAAAQNWRRGSDDGGLETHSPEFNSAPGRRPTRPLPRHRASSLAAAAVRRAARWAGDVLLLVVTPAAIAGGFALLSPHGWSPTAGVTALGVCAFCGYGWAAIELLNLRNPRLTILTTHPQSLHAEPVPKDRTTIRAVVFGGAAVLVGVVAPLLDMSSGTGSATPWSLLAAVVGLVIATLLAGPVMGTALGRPALRPRRAILPFVLMACLSATGYGLMYLPKLFSDQP